MTKNKIDEHATLSHLGQVGKTCSRKKWMKKETKALLFNTANSPVIKIMSGSIQPMNIQTLGFNSASLIQTGVCGHHLKLLLCGSVCRGT